LRTIAFGGSPSDDVTDSRLDWVRLWAFAKYDLLLSRTEFLDLAPIEFYALKDRWIFAKEDHDFRSALICTVIANGNRSKKRRPFKVKDFIPERRGKNKEVDARQTWKQQLELAKQLTIAYGGKLPGTVKRRRRRKRLMSEGASEGK
jgi:hypothetical protein